MKAPGTGRWLVLIAAGLVVVAVVIWAIAPDHLHLSARGPNVLLITVDTLRADHLGAYGYPVDVSPHVDSLARQGVVFERAIAASSRTTPSHASIMTSRFTREHSIGYLNGGSRLDGETTVAEVFRGAGYQTAAFVGNWAIRKGVGLDAGFDVYDDAFTTPELNRQAFMERLAEDTTRRALAWLESVDAGPLFLWVHYQDPHGPYTPPAGYRAQVPRAPDGEPELRLLRSETGFRGIPAYQALEGVRRLSEYQALYAGEIEYADTWIGALVAAFDAHPSKSESEGIVLFTADHGESFGENDLYLVHGEETTPDQARVPFILRSPGLAPGRRADTVHHVDVLPTLLEQAGLPVPSEVRGLALGPFLRTGRPVPDRLVYCDIGNSLSAFSEDRFTRVLGVGLAWLGVDRSPNTWPVTWTTYRWAVEPTWQEIELARHQVETIRAYFGTARPLRPTPILRDLDLDRLRTLGYVEEQVQ